MNLKQLLKRLAIARRREEMQRDLQIQSMHSVGTPHCVGVAGGDRVSQILGELTGTPKVSGNVKRLD